eukprot:TRINITY_DN7892_c0_g1_i2.p2 TRINITY_DN7892_c0_g1~~TRINITY_DN7892_c0_g1_i2.p2  ORF type:complete len:147 (-),score=58.58 TRINITY_DN7892_c0_g1_i2:102-542(-)
MLSHLMNYNFLAAKNYWKKTPKDMQTSGLFDLSWQICKSVGRKTYHELPDMISKYPEKYKSIAGMLAHWHNQRMWEYVENGYESISMETLKTLGIVGTLDAMLKAKGYEVKDGFVFPKRQEKARTQIDPAAELRAISDVMKSLEAS